MEKHIFFNNAIVYNKNVIKENTENHSCENLSTLLYVYSKHPFNLSNIIDIDKIIAIYSENGQTYNILVQKDIQELALAFDFELSEKTTSVDYNLENLVVSNTSELMQKLGEYKEKCIKLLFEIEEFYKEREKFIIGQSIRHLSPYEESCDEDILKLFSNLQEILPSLSVEVSDYEYGTNFIQKHKIEDLYTISNYKLLKDFCKKYSLNCSKFTESDIEDLNAKIEKAEIIKNKINSGDVEKYKYWEYQEELSELEDEIYEYREILQEINSSKFYKREFFAMLYISLENLILKEEALDNFINKIIDNELQVTEI